MKRKLGTMEMRLYKKIVDEGKNMGISQITLHGFGEPLTDKYFFDKVRYAKRKGISKVTTNTNGILLDFEKIKKIFESGLDEIYISFDAASELTYRKIRPRLNFSQIEENIRQLTLEKKKREVQKPKIFLSFVETKENISEEEQYLKRWGRLVDGISISKMHNWAGGIKLDFEKAKKDPCRLLWTDMVVSWDGKVPLCCNDYENRVILGDLNSQNISEVWQGEKLKKIRGKHQKSLFNEIKLCANCQSNFHYRMPWWGV